MSFSDTHCVVLDGEGDGVAGGAQAAPSNYFEVYSTQLGDIK